MSAPRAPALRVRQEEVAPLVGDLVAWYRRVRRDLPWRRTRDPYAIWVSEIMLQQTRVETVAPRFERWLRRFPSIEALATAPLDDVLAEWAGLGYYARARNLHLAAREVTARYGGRLPDDAAAVRALPGVGRYTAGAVMSIAFDRPEPILDGNVIRVLSRVFQVGGDPRAPAAQRRLWTLAAELAAAGPPSDVNQALMELGATLCSPRAPACPGCPLFSRCAARRAGVTDEYPGSSRAAPVRAMPQVAVAVLRRGQLLLVRRPPRGLWGGLYELPSGEPLEGEEPAAAARRVARERVGLEVESLAPLDRFEQLLTHRRVTFHAFRAAATAGRVRRSFYDAHVWLAPARADALGVSRATRRLLDLLGNTGEP